MNPTFAVLLASALLALPLSAAEKEKGGSVKKDVQGAGQAIKREWKKGWRATKKVVRGATKGAADAAEKTARKVKENVED